MRALARGQRAAESLMTLTLTPFEPNGTTLAGEYKVVDYDEHDPIPGKVQAPSSQSGDTTTIQVQIGDAQLPVLRGGLHIPITAPIPGAGKRRGLGWEYVVSAIGPQDDPALLNRRYLVIEVPAKSFATARRLDVVEVSP